MDIKHSLHYIRQELTSPIASTEREPMTFRRQAWNGGVIYIIVNLCAQYMYTNIMYRKFSKYSDGENGVSGLVA